MIVSVLALLPLAAPRVDDSPVLFRTDVVAVLSRVGCNSGACHGSPQGKNGFHLSLRGGDADYDYGVLTRDPGGRRTATAAPDSSLILLKGSGRVAHQGGTLFGRSDPAYQAIARWVG